MSLGIYANPQAMGEAAAEFGAAKIRAALAARGQANIILATGASQFEMLSRLIKAPDIDWSRITIFHLDEYVGLPETHPASFRLYIKTRIAEQLPAVPAAVHYIEGNHPNPQSICDALETEINRSPIDVCFIGIGKNGHLAFNDPPADFESERAYLVVNLDEACRQQQLGEGWFPSFDDVPKQAISMGVRQIVKSKNIINTIPDARKADAVLGALTGPVTNTCPASILQQHPSCFWFLDVDSASKLPKEFSK